MYQLFKVVVRADIFLIRLLLDCPSFARCLQKIYLSLIVTSMAEIKHLGLRQRDDVQKAKRDYDNEGTIPTFAVRDRGVVRKTICLAINGKLPREQDQVFNDLASTPENRVWAIHASGPNGHLQSTKPGQFCKPSRSAIWPR